MQTAARHSRSAEKLRKTLLISDIDGTIVDMWNAWAQATRRAIGRLAYTRRMEVEEVEQVLAATSRDKGISLVDDLGFVIMESPLADRLDSARVAKATQAIGVAADAVDTYILRQWWRDRDRFSVLHERVEPTLWAVREQGGRIVLYSDSPITLVAHRLWVSGFHLALVDAVYCRADPPGMQLRGLARPEPGSPEAQFKALLRGHCTLFPAHVKKPDRASMAQILSDFDTPPDAAIMIGDHAVDIASARLIPGITGVWDIDGARVDPQTIEQYKRLNQWGHYGIGEDSIRARMAELGVTPDLVLDRTFDQLTRYVDFTPPPHPPEARTVSEDDPF